MRGAAISSVLLMMFAGCAAQAALPASERVQPASPAAVRLVVLGDTGVVDAEVKACEPVATADQQPEITIGCRAALRAAVKAERADAVLDLGDLVYELGPVCPDGRLTDAARRTLDEHVGGLQAGVDSKLVLALGNHDVHHRRGYPAAETCYLEYARLHPGKIVFPERNFVMDLGVAKVVVLDTNRALAGGLAGQLRAEMRGDGWLLMAAHHVWRTYGDKHGQRHGQKVARRLGRDPDLWLNGHAHFLQFGVYAGAVDASRKVAALTSGAAGKLRPQDECADPRSGAAGLPACAAEGELYGQSRYGYALVEIDADRLRVIFKDVNGAALFAWERRRGEADGAVVPLDRLAATPAP
jgi:hypothetical protein